jgi:predicted small lipoprotein YifL
MKAIRLLIALAAIVLAISLSACGKRGDPEPPNKESTYPRTYPSQ